MRYSKLGLGTLMTLAMSCASSGQSAKGAPQAAPDAVPATQQVTASPNRYDPNVLTQAEILATPGLTTALQAVTRLRPQFMRAVPPKGMNSAPSGPLVRLDGQELGELPSLSRVESGLVDEIRYYSVVEADTKFGGMRGRPVIAVSTRKR